MNKTEMPQFSKLMIQVANVYSKPMNAHLIEIYWQVLSEFEYKAVEQALLSHVKNPDVGQFMPKPADIVRYIKGSSQTQALQAWSLVLKTIQRVGAYSSVVFDDPIIHAVIADMGGWISLCSVTEKETPFKAQEFEKRYTGFLTQSPKSYPKQLTGLTNQENSANGFPTSRPVFIGNTQYALEVYRGGSENILPCYQPQTPLKQLSKNLAASRDLETNEGE